jgi:hypothetical protein
VHLKEQRELLSTPTIFTYIILHFIFISKRSIFQFQTTLLYILIFIFQFIFVTIKTVILKKSIAIYSEWIHHENITTNTRQLNLSKVRTHMFVERTHASWFYIYIWLKLNLLFSILFLNWTGVIYLSLNCYSSQWLNKLKNYI